MSNLDNSIHDEEIGPILNVSISINDIKIQFNGMPESVLSSVISFISKQIPEIEIAKKIALNYSVKELVERFSDFIKITPEGPAIISSTEFKLSDKEMVVLYLVAMRIARQLGKIQDECVSIYQIQSSTSLNPKSTSSRISELVKSGYVTRDTNKNDSQGAVYSINTAGIYWLNSSISKKRKT